MVHQIKKYCRYCKKHQFHDVVKVSSIGLISYYIGNFAKRLFFISLKLPIIGILLAPIVAVFDLFIVFPIWALFVAFSCFGPKIHTITVCSTCECKS